MAGTRRIQNAINGLKGHPNISIQVIVLRQSSKKNSLAGVHHDITYETVMGDLFGYKLVFSMPLLYWRTRRKIHHLFKQGQSNVLYVYGPSSFDNSSAINYARGLGYKIIFDIVEDHEHAYHISKRLMHHAKIRHIRRLSRLALSKAHGIVVISSHLENKILSLTSGAVPIHKLSISIDMALYPKPYVKRDNSIHLLYGGSFGEKDGIPVLLNAFNELASKRNHVKLVLTGQGDDESMRILHGCIEASPFKNRISYRGYLDDNSYYQVLQEADILCMPRIDSEYAQAGYPFKLGEYLATGKPVIASSVSDLPKLLRNRKDAMLVTPGDSSAMAEAAGYLIDNPEQSRRIGESGRAIAKLKFDYREQGKDLYNFIHAIAASG